MAIQMRRGLLADYETYKDKLKEGEFAVTTDENLDSKKLFVNLGKDASGKSVTKEVAFVGGEVANPYETKTIPTTATFDSISSKALLNRIEGNTEKKQVKLPVITKQPVDWNGSVGETVSFTIEVQGDELTYQWQYCADGGTTWTSPSASSSKTANYSFTAKDTNNGYNVRCLVFDKWGNTVISDVVYATQTGNVAIVEQPLNTTVALDEPKAFTVKARGAGLTYQWQYSRDGGSSWTNSSAVDAGAKSPSYAPAGRETNDGLLLRCAVTNATGQSVTSDVATMRIGTPIEITSQPSDTFIEDGTSGTFSVVATGTGLSYKWQTKKIESNVWGDSTSSSSTTPNWSLAMRDVNNNLQCRCKITDSYGSVIYSDVANAKMPHNALYSVGDNNALQIKCNDLMVSIPLENPLCKLNDLVDRLVLRSDGTGYIEKKCGWVDLGSLSWQYNTISNNRRAFYAPYAGLNMKGQKELPLNCINSLGLTPVAQMASSWGTNAIVYNSNAGTLPAERLAIILPDTAYTDATAFKTAMNGIPLVYELAQPTITELSAEQLREIYKLKTFDGQTTIEALTDCECEFEVKVATSESGALMLTSFAQAMENKAKIDLM